MNLSRIDLNLFTVFDAIYREGGITAASKRLHLSQPAVSHALGRLRELLDDPLFERHGNEMIPTPLARTLAVTIGSSLNTLEQMMHRAGRFDPADSPRVFTIAVRESQEPAFLPSLLAKLATVAPNIDVATIRIERRDLEDDLQSGELDFAIDVGLPLSAEVRREHVSSAPLVVLAREDHPILQGALDLETYLSQEHVLVTGRRRGRGYEDGALAKLGVTRRIRLRCQQHAAANEIVSRTNLLATFSRKQAELVNKTNQVLLFPAALAPLESYLYWHARSEEDPASRWFKAQLLEALHGSALD
ncbi:MAG TPA: LysR family transcriptional regulator [Steroidobacteraceae bacterium]|nr:LysR family transcriptional regulator [Steroidobacteraceae bacterium]